MDIIEPAGRWAQPDVSGATYIQHHTSPDLSVGTYCLVAGAEDTQSPHSEDEVYVVTGGRGRITSGGQTVDVGPGSVVFVPAAEPHRFHDITEDLALLVVFAPAYGTRSTHLP